jgi:FG-GAP-like repeat/PKD domain/Secretion system C-terminal sorting domain
MKKNLQKRQVLVLLFSLFTLNLFPQQFVEQTGIVLPGVTNSSVAWGDYNNDGYLDILLTGKTGIDPNWYPISRIFRNNGNNTFSEQTGISLRDVEASSVDWGDYNNDGYLDIILTGSWGSNIYRNNGNNTFTDLTGLPLSNEFDGSVAWGDYDNDGNLDIVLVGNGYSKIYRNLGNNLFIEQSAISLTGVNNKVSVAWGDYDNDGKLDILLTGKEKSGEGVSKVYHNNGNNTFTEQSGIYLTGVLGSSVAWGDYDNDGDLDILLTGGSSEGNISKVYRNNGDKSFTEQTSILLTGVIYGSVAWGDYNNDGYLDILLTGESGSGSVSKIYRNNGDNTFTEQTGISLTGVMNGSVAWGDYDIDGDLDILLTGISANGKIISKIYRNNIGNPNTKPSVPANLNTVIKDGIVTFIWSKATDNQTAQDGLNYNLYVYESGQTNYKSPPHAFRQSDVLNGKRLVAKIGNIQWSANSYPMKDLSPDKTYYWTVQAVDNGLFGGPFASEQSFTMPLYKPTTQASYITIPSLQDNQMTLKWANGGGTKRAVFIKQGTNGTADPIDNTTYALNSLTPGGWKCAYNGSDMTAIVTGLSINTSYSVQVTEYNGTPGNEKYLTSGAARNPVLFSSLFTEQTGISLKGVIGNSAWGDYDNDGNLDILLAGSNQSIVYRNNGNNSFTEQTGISLTGIWGGSAAWGDYNNDGYLDIILTGFNGSGGNIPVTKIYKNTRNNNFIEQTGISLPPVTSSSVAWGDYNSDGYLDILLTGQTASGYLSKIYTNNGDNTFSDLTGPSLTAFYRSSVVWGDYDNDGKPDILLTGRSISWPISKIYHNDDNGTFTEQTGISLTGVEDSSVDWGDYDNDGDLDILLTGTDITGYRFSKIYRNNGNNTFTEQQSIHLTGVTSGSVDWGDYDNDGNLDILLAGYSDSEPVTKLYRNNGDNTFTEQTSIQLTGVNGPSSVVWGDYDNDGDLDILLTGWNVPGQSISKIYRNNIEKINKIPGQPGNLSYELQGKNALLKWDKVTTDETSSKSITYNIKVGRKSGASNFVPSNSDLNGFRRITTMGNTQFNTTYLFKNLRWDTTYFASVQAIDNSFKGGAFSNEVQFKIGAVQASDLNAAHVSNGSIMLKWKRGNGDRCIIFAREGTSGTANPQKFTTYFASPVFAEGSTLGSTDWYCVYKGEADSVLLSGLNPQKNYTIYAIEFQGKNGSEIYGPSLTSENMGIFSSSLFSEQTGIALSNVAYGSVTWGDYDNDGFVDILITGNPGPVNSSVTKIYHNNGDNTFSEQTSISLPGVSFSSVAWCDYNNDGFLDILLTGVTSSGYLSKIYRNNGNNTFTEQAGISLTGVDACTVAWGDYDNDGNLDFLLTGQSYDGYISKLYKNNGNNTFTEQTGTSLPGVDFGSPAWGDYDDDGNLDLLLTGYTGSNGIAKIYRNNGDNTFTEQTNIVLAGLSAGSAAWGDYDNDGYPDILLTGSGYSKIYHNNGDNTFTEQTGIHLTGINYGSAAWGDYDNDGFLDILLTGSTGSSYISRIYHNIGDNTFTEQTGILLTDVDWSSVAWCDYDNDGDLDILMTGFDASNNAVSKIYRNNLVAKSGSFKPNSKPSAPTGLKNTINPGTTEFSWSQINSDETPAPAMSYNLRYKLIDAARWKFAPHAAENGYRRIPAMGNLQLNKSFSLKNLHSGTYYWQVQAVDQGYAGGAWSAVDSFIVKNTQAFFKTDTVCRGSPTHFTDQSASADGVTSWKWDYNDGTTSTSQNPIHIFQTSGILKVKLVITSSLGVKDSLEQNVAVKSRPIADFSATTACQGTETALTNLTNTSGLNIASWSWDYGDGKGSTFQNPGSHGYLTAGDYQLALTATASNKCSGIVVKTATVGAYPIAAITANAPLLFCNGDSVILSVGTNPQYSYRWMLNNTGITNAIANNYTAKMSGNYSVEVTNTKGSCKTTSSQVAVTKLAMPATPVIVTQNYQEGKCPGENQIVLSVDQPVIEYSYQWKRNGTPISNATGGSHIDILSAGDYSVTANLSGCRTESAVKTITYENAPPKPLIYIHGPNVWYLACSISSAEEYKYRWYYNGILIPEADKYIYVANQNLGNYYVTIENTKGCYSSSDVVKIPTGDISTEETDPFAGLKIYPNPSPGQFVVEMDNQAYGEIVISVLAQGGRQVLSKKFDKTTEHFLNQLDLSGQAKGIYIINFKTDKFLVTRKLVVE